MKIRFKNIIKNGFFLLTLIASQCVGSAYVCPSKEQNPDVEKLSLTSLSGEGIPSTQNLPLKAIDRASLTTIQRLTLLKEEVGMMRHSMDDFAAFIIKNGLQSPEVADHYQDYLSSHQFKLKGAVDGQKALSIYQFISLERLVDKDFLQYCDLALEAILGFQETLSKSSIEAFYREVLIALSLNANSIYESVCSYLEKKYPNIFFKDSLGASCAGLPFDPLSPIFNIDKSYFTLLINLRTLSSFTIQQFEEKGMECIQSYSDEISYAPLKYAYNMTRLFLNIEHELSSIYGFTATNVFERLAPSCVTTTVYLKMLSTCTQGIDRKHDVKILNRLIKIKLNRDAGEIRAYLLTTFPEINPMKTTTIAQFHPSKRKKTKNKGRGKGNGKESRQKQEREMIVTSSVPAPTTTTQESERNTQAETKEEKLISSGDLPSTQENQVAQDGMPVPQTISSEDRSSSDEKDDEDVWDYDAWYLENVLKYKNEIASNTSTTPPGAQPLLPALNINSWKIEAQLFFNVVMGQRPYQPLVREHFDAFLKAVGGTKIKMTQRGYIQIRYSDQSVETKYTIPNRTNSRGEMPYFIFTIHQPHANGEFPKRTLFDFFRYQLQKAGY